MKARTYLAVAQELILGATEAHWRTATGRAYYALMLELRDTMTDWGLSTPNRIAVHQIVRGRVYTSKDTGMKWIGVALDELRKQRGIADYETVSVRAFLNELKAADCLKISTEAIQRFDEVCTDQTRRRQVFAEMKRVFP